MSRVIKVNDIGKERTYLTKSIVAAIRKLATLPELGIEGKDLISYIIISLKKIFGSIDSTVQAWEKRDYWVKADRFRSEWAWTEIIADKLLNALLIEDWGTLAQLIVLVGNKLGKVNVSENNRLGTPWKGCWDELNSQIKKII